MKSTGRFARWTALDTLLLWLVAAIGAVAAFVVLFAPRFVDPQEDAVILFQYSRNLAHTGAITFITHGPHAEGATDFLWMVMIAFGIKLGANPAWVVAFLNFVSLGAITWLLFRIARVPYRVLPALFVVGVFALLPYLYAALTGFSVLPFTALLLLLMLCFLERRDAAMALMALVLCLFRPDGVVFAVPMLLAALVIYDGRGKRLAWDVALFVLPGIGYFLWRWHYFGERLPLPFLVKSDTTRVAHVLVLSSFHQVKPLLIFFGIPLILALRRRMQDRVAQAVLLCGLVLPLCFYLAMRLDQNIGLRFFVFLFAISALLFAMKWQQIAPQAHVLLRVGALLWIVVMVHEDRMFKMEVTTFQPTNRRAIAEQLATLPHGRLLMTEAGVLPYYSQWDGYDAWGLNTAEFAHHLFQPEDVAQVHPDVILMYTNSTADECAAHPEWQTPYSKRDWTHLTRNVVAGADPREYDLLVAPYGSPKWRAREGYATWQGWQECWFVHRASPQFAAVEDILRAHSAISLTEWKQRNAAPEDVVPVPKRHGAAKLAYGVYRRLLQVQSKLLD